MEYSVILAGFGGQGILSAGQILAQAAVVEGRHTLWIPSYGPEMRGGTASCTVIVGDTPIGSPVVDRADGVVVLTPPALAKFGPLVAVGGVLVVNDTLIEAEIDRADILEVRVPATALATRAGDDRLASVVALGALIARLPVVAEAALRTALVTVVGAKHPEVLEADLAALDAGFTAGGAHAGGHAAGGAIGESA
jgi:2-oxoglutarate ferredoxin oxidoreductase subunit gamma